MLSELEGLSREARLGRITSARPTRYRLSLEGAGDVHVFCAFDALLYPLLAGRAVRLEATGPDGSRQRLEITPDGPDPQPLWLSWVEPDAPLPASTGMPARRCPYLHLFASREALEAWRAGLSSGVAGLVEPITLDEAWRRARSSVGAA